MTSFDPQKYHRYLLEQRDILSSRARELKMQIGREEGAMQSWSRPAQKAMEQDLDVVLAQLDLVESQLKEFVALSKSRKVSHDVISPGSVVTVGTAKGEERFFIVSGSGNPQFGVLSLASPLGSALKGRKVGEKVELTMGEKSSSWLVLKVE